jgi:hypothetical protein
VGDVVLLSESAVLSDILNSDTIRDDPSVLSALNVNVPVELGEAPLLAQHNLLSSRELELGTAKSLNDVLIVRVLGADRDNDLPDVDTSSHLHRLTIRSTHTGGETIGSGAGKHLVLTNDVERVSASADVVAFLARGLDQILVASDTGSLKSAGSKLLLLIGHKVGDERESIDRSSLGSTVIDTNLGVGDTTAKA